MENIHDRIDRIENRNKVNMFEIEKRLTAMETVRTDSELGAIAGRLRDMEDLIFLLQTELTKIKDTLTGGAELELPNPTDIEHRIRKVEERILQLPETTTEHIPLPDTQHLEEEIEKLKDRTEVLEKTPTTLPAPSFPTNASSDINERLNNLEQVMESVGGIENMLIAIEEKIKDLTMLKSPVASASAANTDTTEIEKRLYSRLENKLIDLESKIKVSTLPGNIEQRLEYVENEVKDITDIRRDLESESANRSNLEKKILDLNHSQVAPTIGVENLRSELENQKAILEDLEKNTELKATKYISKHLDQFTKMMDNKIGSMEAPKVDARLKAVEQKVERLIALVKKFSDTAPIVIE